MTIGFFWRRIGWNCYDSGGHLTVSERMSSTSHSKPGGSGRKFRYFGNWASCIIGREHI